MNQNDQNKDKKQGQMDDPNTRHQGGQGSGQQGGASKQQSQQGDVRKQDNTDDKQRSNPQR